MFKKQRYLLALISVLFVLGVVGKDINKSSTKKDLLPHRMKMSYIIPENRCVQDGAVEKFRNIVKLYQQWYADQMEGYGFGPKTFIFETEADGVTQKINLLYSTKQDSYFRDNPWSNVGAEMGDLGHPVWQSGDVNLITYEAHIMNSDGSVTGGYNGGASYGNGSDGGVAMTCAISLTLTRPQNLTDNRYYDGIINQEVGQYPMAYGKTFYGFDGDTISSISSVLHGIFMHEAGHAFGLYHNFVNDRNFAGNLMGNGFRGFRGWVHPEHYPENKMRLSYANALALNCSRYFNGDQIYSDAEKPTVTIHTGLNPQPVAGQLEISFTATDNQGLSCALLLLDSVVVKGIPLEGTTVTQTIKTPWFTPSVSNEYRIFVFDQEGNKEEGSFSPLPLSGYGRAPIPLIDCEPAWIYEGDSIAFVASHSYDHDSSNGLLMEWDLDCDGTFDTAPAPIGRIERSYDTPGFHKIQARITDASGYSSVSEPISFCVREIVTSISNKNADLFE